MDLTSLEAKATELEVMISYVRAKIDWLTLGEQGQQPDFGSYARGRSQATGDRNFKPLRAIGECSALRRERNDKTQLFLQCLHKRSDLCACNHLRAAAERDSA
jgi:hypothetical protein